MDLQTAGRLLLIIGLVLAALGGLLWFLGRYFGLGNLPGDVQIRGQGFTCFIPIVTMIVLSVIVTIILNIIVRIINRP